MAFVQMVTVPGIPLDASALEWVRRAIGGEVSVAVPALVLAEVGTALSVYVRETALTLDGALNRLAFVRRMPLEVRELDDIITPAMRFAITSGLSVYDACYAVLAETEKAVLVTADRRLAGAVTRAELI